MSQLNRDSPSVTRETGSALPKLKIMYTPSPSSVNKSSWKAEKSYEDNRLLTPTNDEWQVLKVFDGLWCFKSHYVLEFVRLQRVNFGIRWRNGRDIDAVPPGCMIGPHWYLMVATWSFFSFLMVMVNVLTIEKARTVEIGAGVFLSGMCLICYAPVGCTDPGIVPR